MNFDETLRTLINERDQDFYIYVGTIEDDNVDKFIKIIRDKEDRKKGCSLILTTYGGDPDAGYRIIRSIKRYYDSLTIYVFGVCKSTGTLMALGADEIVMSDFGEFGPLDIQLAKDDELSNMSGLNFVQSLVSLNDQLYKSFEENFLGLKRRSQGSITTKTAAEIGSRLSIGLISPISAQIDPVKLGEVQRAISIAHDYGSRLCDDYELVSTLITSYPSHGFVIDYDEAKSIFKNVRWVDEDEVIIERSLIKLMRRQRTELISELIPEEEESDNVSEDSETAEIINLDTVSNVENVENQETELPQENPAV
ncbi:hypothetical protein PQ459_10025 [Chryseobacterium sp. KACC 21268]|nr:hypothetical protein PQ459_10025 [Chryseobacterium sp. KACC 21268]